MEIIKKQLGKLTKSDSSLCLNEVALCYPLAQPTSIECRLQYSGYRGHQLMLDNYLNADAATLLKRCLMSAREPGPGWS